MPSPGPEWKFDQLFGRETETKLLTSLVSDENRSHHQATVILHGATGSGKSSLIQGQSWQEHGRVLAMGKFESHRTVEPFSALTKAVEELVEVLCQQNELSGLPMLLKQDIPFLEKIAPRVFRKAQSQQCHSVHQTDVHQTDEEDVSPWAGLEHSGSLTMKQDLATVDCVNASFVRLLKFLGKQKPIVLFLDDVHFADQASLDVIQVLATTQESSNLLLVLSYRDEEARACGGHMLDTLEKIKKSASHVDTSALESRKEQPATPQDEGAKVGEENEALDNNLASAEKTPPQKVHELTMRDLSVDSVNELVACLTQRLNLQETLPLARVVHKKTAGNPFFVTQFLQMLRQEDFVRYSFSTFQWEWGDVTQLENAAHVSDNVADIIAKTIQSLPEATVLALKVASCLGKIIPLHVLMEWFNVHHKKSKDSPCCRDLQQLQIQGLQAIFNQAVDAGILICAPGGNEAYSWAHDKLQRVTYSLIQPQERQSELHLHLGRLLWRMSKQHPHEEWMVFLAADQMNRFSELCPKDSASMGSEVAALCLEAAQLSLSKSALYPAHGMLQAGVRHLGARDRWTTHYNLSLRLYSTLAELAIQLGKREEATAAIKEVKDNAKTVLEKFRVQTVELKYTMSGTDRNYKLGLEKTIAILKEGYGIKMPSKFFPGQLMLECQKLRRKFPGGKLEGLLQLPRMTDVPSRNIMKLLVCYLGFFSHLTPESANLAWYSGVKALQLSAEKGVTEETALAVAGMGVAIRQQGNYKEANEYAELCLKLIDQFQQTVGSVHSTLIGFVTAGIYSATKPLNKCLDLWLESHHVALRTGITEKAGSAIIGYTMTYLSVGLPLDPLKADLAAYEKEARQFNIPESVVAVFKIFQRFIASLQNEDGQPQSWDEELDLLSNLSGNAERMTRRDLSTFALMLQVISGDLKSARELVTELESFSGTDHFVARSALRESTMALAAYKLSRSGKQQRQLRRLAKRITKDFYEDLKRGNVNAAPLYFMLKAEESPSKEHYEHAIRSCARLGLVHFEAYMCEQAASYFSTDKVKDEGWAEFYMAQAIMLYEDWGAKGKAHQLQQDFSPALLQSASLRERANSALKGRTRYSSLHADMLMDFDWGRLSNTDGSVGRSLSFTSNPEDVDLTESEVSSSDSGSTTSRRRSSSGSLWGGSVLFGTL